MLDGTPFVRRTVNGLAWYRGRRACPASGRSTDRPRRRGQRIPWRMSLVPSSATPSATRHAPCAAVAKLLA
jgi:hypothetical protein